MSIEQNENDSSHLPVPAPPTPGRIHSHSLRPQHSRIDYARRKSASELTCLEFSIENNDSLDEIKKTSSVSWLKRRFTLFSFEPTVDENHRITTTTADRCSIFDERSYSDLLRQKRPSVILQMIESFARRISSRKKKRSTERDREEDQPVIDPVYETLKIAAETRKRSLAFYLQKRQQTLNKQTSLNSQGSSEPDIQPSPRVTRQQESTAQAQTSTSSSSDNARISNC